jgi:glycosyltransferase involved in cell wall biosynthesis
MRIMVVTDQYAPMVGGVPSVTRALALGLARRGHRVALLVPSPGWRGTLDAEEEVSVLRRGSVPWPWYQGMRLALVPGAAGRRLITAFAPDVIHIHSPVTLGAGARAAARRLGIPVVYTNHYLPANVRPSRRRQPRALDALFYRYIVGFSNRCSHVTAPTATALRLLRDRGLRVPSRVISNGVDPAAYSPGPADERLRDRYGLPRGCPLILSVGRLSPEKRVDVLLDAAARLTRDAHVAIAGTGPDEAGLRARAGRLGLTGQVSFLGFVPGPDLPGLYRLADVFAIASEAELQSLTTMEAMATGLPVVAADRYALAELVRHGRNGFLASPGRSEEFAACLDILVSDPGLRAAMAAESLRVIGGHEDRHQLAEWESLYGLLAATGPGDPTR